MPTATLPLRKTERLEARVSPEFKNMVERAAHLSGHHLSSFMLFALESTARRTVVERQEAVLSSDETKAFVKALLSPPKPNKHLRAAFGEYRRTVKGAL